VEKDWDSLDVCIDTGSEEYVEGRPYPMIDPRLRNEMIVQESEKEDVAVILFDVMLGYGSAMDPVDGLESVARGPALVASITGTKNDEQDMDEVEQELRELGVSVFTSSAQAAEFAAKIAEGIS
jgi:FdrA protein